MLAALAAGQVTESVGRLICLWTGKLPEKYREDVRRAAAGRRGRGPGGGGAGALFAEMYERARGDLPDEDPGRDFADRGVKLATTFGGAGVVHGDLTPECAEMLGRVLDALGAPGRERRRPDRRSSGTTTRWPRPCGGCWRPGCCPSGRGSR